MGGVGVRPSPEFVQLWCPSLAFESLGPWSPPWLGAARLSALCAESEVRKAVERSSYAVALKFRVFFLLLKSVKF